MPKKESRAPPAQAKRRNDHHDDYDDEDRYDSKGRQYKPKSSERPFVSPLKKHYCTDVICLLLLWIFIIALAFVSVFAYMNGDPAQLILPHDSTGLLHLFSIP
jgi:hypothetical protein